MGLASFNRMRMRQVETMKPENIQKRQEETKAEEKKVEETKAENVEEMPSKRVANKNKKTE